MIPTIDPRVKYVGASHLRKLNSAQLRQLDGVIVVRDNSEPLVVIVPYETYLTLQRAVKTTRKIVEEEWQFEPATKSSTGAPPARELLVELDREGEE